MDKQQFKHLQENFQNYKNHRPSSNRPDFKKIALWILLGIGALIGFSILFLATAIALLSFNLPDVKDLDKLSVPESTTIYDREGNVLYVKFGEENREYKKLAQMSPNIVHATLAIEDDQFYNHPGFDTMGLIRAGINDITGGNQQGGSTITQQYIKLTFLSSEKSITRKLKELILAVRLEEAFDKDTILEKYLNKIPYGNNAFGVEKAAQTYFNKSSHDLSIAESAILAGIPQAPSYYNPYGTHKFTTLSSDANLDTLSNRNIQTEANLLPSEIQRGLLGQNVKIGNNEIYLQGRADLVLKRLEDTKYISEEERQQAQNDFSKIVFNKYKQSIKAPHFVFYVIDQLEQKYGKDLVEQGGLKVTTTIDPKMQAAAEKAISDRSDNFEKKYNVKNSALVSMNPKTGEIYAMVGSRNYFDTEIDGQTNVTTSFRQPGSSFKPFVYAEAFLKRYAPSTVVFDVPTPIGTDTPKNFDGKFLGPISIREALAQSRNIPAIKAYFLAGEQKEILPLAKSMGVEFRDETAEYGYPFAIGAAETTLLGMTNGYGTFADAGVYNPPVSILRVENAKGEVLEQHDTTVPGQTVLDPQVAYLITSILTDTQYRLGPLITLNGRTNAAKTGTSNRKVDGKYYPNDLLTLGYTPSLVTGVWSGNNDSRKDGELSNSADGYNISGPIFKAYMDEALKNTPVEEFPIPDGIKQETVSKYNGKLASPLTPVDQQVTDFFASFSVPTEVDDSNQQVVNFSAAESLAAVYCSAGQKQGQTIINYHDIDPTRVAWEQAAQTWLSENLPDFNQSSFIGCTPATNAPVVKILTPSNDQTVAGGTYVDVSISSSNPIREAHYYLDDKLVNVVSEAPYYGRMRFPRNGTQTTFKITVRVYDQDAQIGQDQITINLPH